jgi:hemoglobin
MTQAENNLYHRIGEKEGIAKLLHHFYADVRQHNIIGPIFNKQIKDWPTHLLKIGEFWARVTGGPSNYSGQMPLKHLELGLTPEHFKIWLQLWDMNCRIHLKPEEADELSRLAHEIGARLKSILSSVQSSPFGTWRVNSFSTINRLTRPTALWCRICKR